MSEQSDAQHTAERKSSIRLLKRQPHPSGTLYGYHESFPSDCFSSRGRLFIFNEAKDFVETRLGGLEGALRLRETEHPGDFETGQANVGTDENPEFVFLKGHPYQSLLNLHRIEQEMPKSDRWALVPSRKYFGTSDLCVSGFIDAPTCDVIAPCIDDANIGDDIPYGRNSYIDKAKKLLESSGAFWEGRLINPEIKYYYELFESYTGVSPKPLLCPPPEEKERYRKMTASELKAEYWRLVMERQKIMAERASQEMVDMLSKCKDVQASDGMVGILKRRLGPALLDLFAALENAGKKLRISGHIDAAPRNIFFRGVTEEKILFTIIDQYYCGLEELQYKRMTRGRLPSMGI